MQVLMTSGCVVTNTKYTHFHVFGFARKHTGSVFTVTGTVRNSGLLGFSMERRRPNIPWDNPEFPNGNPAIWTPQVRASLARLLGMVWAIVFCTLLWSFEFLFAPKIIWLLLDPSRYD